MTDQQIIETLGVDETAQMLAARDSLRAKFTPEVYDQCLASYKVGLRAIRTALRLPNYLTTADALVDVLEQDTSLSDDQCEVQKAFVVFAALELEEHA